MEIRDSAGVSTRYEYDLLGRRSRIHNDNGLEVRYGYDAMKCIRDCCHSRRYYGRSGNSGCILCSMGFFGAYLSQASPDKVTKLYFNV